MIENIVSFEEEALKTLFRDRRYLLEALVGDPIGSTNEVFMFRQVGLMNLVDKKESWFRILRQHRPVEIYSFYGCSSYSNDWWAAIIKTKEMVASRYSVMYFFLIGWLNAMSGCSATIIDVSVDKDMLTEMLDKRVKDKVKKGYEVKKILKEVSLVLSVGLPEIEGLPSYEDVFIEEDPKEFVPTPPAPPPPLPMLPAVPSGSPLPTPPVEPEPDPVVSAEEEEEQKKTKKRAEKKDDEKKKKIESIRQLMEEREKESDW